MGRTALARTVAALALGSAAIAPPAGAGQAAPRIPAIPPATAAPAQPTPSGTARISGIVRNADDDQPLARARVMAVSPGLPEPRVVITGADGGYALVDLPAGSYSITATRTGYAPLTYGQGRSVTGTPVAVASGQQVTKIDLPLVPGGVIVGRILDEDGAPFAGALVEALIKRFQNGHEMLFSVASAQTDDRGEFRLFGLAPGPYYLSAADPAFASVSTPNGILHYSATYFPGTTMGDQARTVTVGGGQAPRAEFRLQLVPPAKVSGQLLTYDAHQLLSGAITLSPLEGHGLPIAAPDDPEVFADGRFSFSGVPPGRYEIRARGQTAADSTALFAVYSVEVSGADLDRIQMTLRPGAMLDGALSIEAVRGTTPPALSTLRVRAPLVDGTAFGDALTGAVHAGGAYRLRGVMKGSHQIVVDGLQPPWVLKSVRYRGSDITDLPLDVAEKEQIHGVRIAITDAASEVSGTVRNGRDRPAGNTGVLVCPKVSVFWMRTSRRLRVTYTDADGNWRIAGLPAGEYFAVASPLIDESDLGRRDRLEALQAIGTPFRVDADTARSVVALQVRRSLPPASAR